MPQITAADIPDVVEVFNYIRSLPLDEQEAAFEHAWRAYMDMVACFQYSGVAQRTCDWSSGVMLGALWMVRDGCPARW